MEVGEACWMVSGAFGRWVRYFEGGLDMRKVGDTCGKWVGYVEARWMGHV